MHFQVFDFSVVDKNLENTEIGGGSEFLTPLFNIEFKPRRRRVAPKYLALVVASDGRQQVRTDGFGQ